MHVHVRDHVLWLQRGAYRITGSLRRAALPPLLSHLTHTHTHGYQAMAACLPCLPTGAAQPAGGSSLLSGPLLIGMALFAFQQFAGINAIVYFSSSVFKQVRAGRD